MIKALKMLDCDPPAAVCARNGVASCVSLFVEWRATKTFPPTQTPSRANPPKHQPQLPPPPETRNHHPFPTSTPGSSPFSDSSQRTRASLLGTWPARAAATNGNAATGVTQWRRRGGGSRSAVAVALIGLAVVADLL